MPLLSLSGASQLPVWVFAGQLLDCLLIMLMCIFIFHNHFIFHKYPLM